MHYVRTFRLQAAHFNSLSAYQTLWRLSQGMPMHPRECVAMALATHGHNFKIEVTLQGDELIDDSWLVDDVKLAEIVMEWDNINLSVHPDFLEMAERATTENMALRLIAKLRKAFGSAIVRQVRVWETEDIHALAF